MGVSRDISNVNLKKKRDLLAKKFHPDKNKDGSSDEKFKRIQLAYEILSDPQQRREFDLNFDSEVESDEESNISVMPEKSYELDNYIYYPQIEADKYYLIHEDIINQSSINKNDSSKSLNDLLEEYNIYIVTLIDLEEVKVSIKNKETKMMYPSDWVRNKKLDVLKKRFFKNRIKN